MNATVTIYAKKSCRSYVDHGMRFIEGGSSSTMDAGWSIAMAIREEERKLKPGTVYRIEKAGKAMPGVFVKK